MCDCSQCSGAPFVFTEIDRSVKPCINLNNASDASNILTILQLMRMLPGFFSINGCQSSLLCTSINELIAWRRDNNLAPTSDAAAVVNLWIPSAVLDQIPLIDNSNC